MAVFMALAFLVGGLYAIELTHGHRKIQLNDDKTWEIIGYEKPSNARKVVKSKKKFVEVWYDSSKWKVLKESFSEAAEFSLTHKGADEGYALFIIEGVEMTLSSLKKVALKNARNAAPDARVTYEEVININGVDVLVMDIRGTIEDIKFVYHSAYWSGPEGVFQIITYTSENIFERVFDDFDELLAGIVVKTSAATDL